MSNYSLHRKYFSWCCITVRPPTIYLFLRPENRNPPLQVASGAVQIITVASHFSECPWLNKCIYLHSFYTGGLKKIFWVLVMLGMAAALLYNVVELTKKYLSYPISVKFSVDHQQQLTFPMVAVCNMSPIKKSSLEAAQTVKRRKKRSAGKYHGMSRLFSIMHC